MGASSSFLKTAVTDTGEPVPVLFLLRGLVRRARPLRQRELRRPWRGLCRLYLDGRCPALFQLDVQAQRAHFLDEHVEALRHAGFEGIVAADNGFVDLGAARDVVGFDRQHLLKRVGSAIRLKRPHLHLTEALTAELSLSAQRLLGDETVRADRARVDLVVHKVMELKEVLIAHRYLPVEWLARASIVERD